MALAATLMGGAGAGWWLYGALNGLDKDFHALVNYRPGEATFIYAADNSLLGKVAKENRIYVELERIPVALRNATVATEDRRFWEHSGVDVKGLARAFWRDVREQRLAEGGSTLTMQLVRNIQLTPEKTFERKVREAALALQLERVYKKPQLLEMYLNQVFYGSGSYGVGAAAKTYFHKPVEKLSIAQSALLATLPRRPTEYNPYRDPESALLRRNALLKEMSAQGYLTPRQLEEALAEPLGVKPRKPNYRRAPYFVDAVVDQLIDRYGPETVYQGGLKVYTTLNPKMQAIAEKSLKNGVASLRGRNVTQGALVSIDPATGEVKALAGGVDYRKSSFNRAVNAKRQPGSVFKPFVFAAAMDLGFTPQDKITDAPFRMRFTDGSMWRPKNHSGGYAGQTTLANALAQSMNIPAVKLTQTIGPSQVANVARSCGIRSKLREVPSLALGTSEVTLLEITGAYSVFANRGTWPEPRLLRKVKSADHKINDSFDASPLSVMDPLTAMKVDYMLQKAVLGGTAKSVRDVPHARGKTGTTQDDKDAWFIGYTPRLVTGVWLGNDLPSRMHNVWGGTGCAPIWERYMRSAVKQMPQREPLPVYAPPKPKPKKPLPSDEDVKVAENTPAEPGWDENLDKGDDIPVYNGTNSSFTSAEYDDAWNAWGLDAQTAQFETSNLKARIPMNKIRICLESGLKAGSRCRQAEMVEIVKEMTPGQCFLHQQAQANRPSEETLISEFETTEW